MWRLNIRIKTPLFPCAVVSRECIECRLFGTGRLADNQTCQRQCKDEIITVETLSKYLFKSTCSGPGGESCTGQINLMISS